MFNLREFVKKGFLSAIGIQSDYWIILTSANWFSKGILTDEDMQEIQAKIDEKNTPVEEPVEEVPQEIAVDEVVEQTEMEE